jgi:hypothetical protein
VIFLGFPFETIANSARRNEYMAAILTFLGPPVRFEGWSVQTDNRLRLTLSGPPGVYALESSATGTNWTPFAQQTNAGGRFEFTDGPVTNTVQRFYRAVRLE